MHTQGKLCATFVVALALGCKGRTGSERERAEPQVTPPALATQGDADAGAERVSAVDANAAPAEDALVDVAQAIPTVVVELRYATTNNFMRQKMYGDGARCLLRGRVVAQLRAAQQALEAENLRFKLWDCYRPFHVQKKLWQKVPDPRYVARPAEEGGAPIKGSRHNRGAAVDLTLVDATGAELPMPTDYDDFSERAHRGAEGIPEREAANAARLEAVMVAAGFEGLPTEWWHFDGANWEDFPLSDEPISAAR